MGAVLINPSLGNQLISNAITAKDATNTPLPIIVLADLAAGTLCGLWNGILVSRVRIQPMVATLILMVAGRGIAQLITNGQIMTIYYSPYFWFGNGFILGLPVSIYIVAAVLILAGCACGRQPRVVYRIRRQSVGKNSKSRITAASTKRTSADRLYVLRFLRRHRRFNPQLLRHSEDANNIGSTMS